MKRFLLFWIFISMVLAVFAQGQTSCNNANGQSQREPSTHVTAMQAREVGLKFLNANAKTKLRSANELQLATNDTYPSWGYMVRNEATTIWELWNGNTADPAMNSGNHVMLLGDLIIWYYEYLGGIRALEPGYCKIQLKPYPIEGLDYVNCSYQSVSGLIESKWKRIKSNGKNNSSDRFEWDILIPANTTAEVWLPTSKGYEKQLLGSGRHHLVSNLN